MDIKLFNRLVETMAQMNEIIDGKRVPSREVTIKAMQVKEIRKTKFNQMPTDPRQRT